MAYPKINKGGALIFKNIFASDGHQMVRFRCMFAAKCSCFNVEPPSEMHAQHKNNVNKKCDLPAINSLLHLASSQNSTKC